MTKMTDTTNCSACGHPVQRDHDSGTNKMTIECVSCGYRGEAEIVTGASARKFWQETRRFPMDEEGHAIRGPRVG